MEICVGFLLQLRAPNFRIHSPCPPNFQCTYYCFIHWFFGCNEIIPSPPLIIVFRSDLGHRRFHPICYTNIYLCVMLTPVGRAGSERSFLYRVREPVSQTCRVERVMAELHLIASTTPALYIHTPYETVSIPLLCVSTSTTSTTTTQQSLTTLIIIILYSAY